MQSWGILRWFGDVLNGELGHTGACGADLVPAPVSPGSHTQPVVAPNTFQRMGVSEDVGGEGVVDVVLEGLM